MLTVNSISKSSGINTVHNNITFNLNPGEKAALVGSCFTTRGSIVTTEFIIGISGFLVFGGSYRNGADSSIQRLEK